MRYGIGNWVSAFVVTAISTLAEDRLPLLRVGNDSYTNVVVTTVTPTDLFFSHAGGMGNVKLQRLDQNFQKHFHFNPTNAANVAKAQVEATKQFYMAKAAEKPPLIAPEPPEKEIAPPPDRPAGIHRKQVSAKRFLGSPPPQLIVEKWLTPEPDTAGKFVLIDFWATWCGPCRAAIPELNALQEHFGDRLVVIGLSDESEDQLRRMKEPKINYAEAIDTQARTKSALQVTGIPHTILMDPQGIVRYEGHPGSLSMEDVNYILQVYDR